MGSESGIIMAQLSVLFMVAVIILTWLDDMFLPSQMVSNRFHPVGFPAVANGAIWGNLVLMSTVLYFIGAYWTEWSVTEILVAVSLGQIVSFVLFWFVYAEGKFPDALAGGGLGISAAGWVMMIYSALVYAAIGLFFFRTSATTRDVLAVSGLLLLYIPPANHAVLGWFNSWFSFPWCPRLFAEEASPLRFIIGGEILVVAAAAVKLA